jgi:hypothetical protein
MALRAPLILISGGFSQLPSGDVVPGLDAAAQASGNAALVVAAGAAASGNAALADVSAALSSGNAALVDANVALSSGNSALVVSATALASGNAGISYADTKLPLSGGVVAGQFAQNIIPLGLNGSGIDCSLGNYFTATISGATQVVISGVPSGVSYLFTYEVLHEQGTITWPTEVKWAGNTAPTLTTGKTHLFMFVTDDQGSRWRGSSLVDYDT